MQKRRVANGDGTRSRPSRRWVLPPRTARDSDEQRAALRSTAATSAQTPRKIPEREKARAATVSRHPTRRHQSPPSREAACAFCRRQRRAREARRAPRGKSGSAWR